VLKSKRNASDSKPATKADFSKPGRNFALVSFGMLLAVVLVSGCSGTVGSTQATTPPQLTYKISGTITPAAGGSGATVTLSGASTGTQTADSSGNYVFAGLAPGNYAITPGKAGFTFSPSTQNVTLSNADITAVNFTATAQQAHTATLSWVASTSTVTGYYVYRSTVDGGPYILLTSSPVAGLTYTDTTVQSGQSYYYVTTSVDGSGNQSGFSNQVQATIP
jgi:carboxypeptidase family protein